jgi:hypothetical protein
MSIDSDQLRLTSELFHNLRTLDRNGTKIGLAIKRLNQAFLRSDDHDSILDVTIGMEAILSDSNDEITHKLALRLAAIVSYAKLSDRSAQQIFKEVKAIYRFGSAVIHGDVRASEKCATITRLDEGTFPTIYVALEHFRNLILSISLYPHFLEASRIDSELLLGESRS